MSRLKTRKRAASVDDTVVHDINVKLVKNADTNFKIVQKYKLTDTHKSFVELGFIDSTKMMFVDGPAGTAKTYCASLLALNLLKSHRMSEIVYIRSIVESASKSMGSLPGEVDDKFLPWTLPLMEKMNELLEPGEVKYLFEKNIIRAVPVNYVRGLTFTDSVVIVDEAQNLTFSELTTILTRFGDNTKMIVIGDTKQSDINGKSGFKPMCKCFDDSESEQNGVFCFRFTDKDIMRSEILRFLVRKIQTNK
jgi:phosphate starvation-inducible PhoH-like protein